MIIFLAAYGLFAMFSFLILVSLFYKQKGTEARPLHHNVTGYFKEAFRMQYVAALKHVIH